MKATRWDVVLSGSARVNRQDSAPQGSDESLFSFLLKVESELRAGGKNSPQLGLGLRKPSKMKSSQRWAPTTLTRYIE
jgi:hypothetical protein